VDVEPRTNYVIDIDQLERGHATGPVPDPGLSADDINYASERSLLTARIHNVGSQAIRNVKGAFCEGDPAEGGNRIATQNIPNIEAPNDLEPRTVSVGVNFAIEGPTDIYVVIDPDGEITSEITTFNNVAHKRLTQSDINGEEPESKPTPATFPRGRGR